MSPSGPHRLPMGGHIDRARPLSFTFNRRPYTGFAGDTLASALLASSLRTVARSFKFHRPRGIFSCGFEEPNALLQVGEGALTVPSERAPLIPLTHGLRARSQLGWPSVNVDLLRSLDFIAPALAAGFYNRTFIWPRWHTYEPMIRRMAGLGRSPTERDPDRYEMANLHCDLLVIGGGVAGLNAALQAGQTGARVVLVEQDCEFGGEALWNGTTVEELPAAVWLARALEQLKALPDVRLFSRTTATGYYDHRVVTLSERVTRAGATPAHAHFESTLPRARYWLVRAGRIVLATGTIEQPLVFDNNDRPGIMLAGAARQYLNRYAVAVGTRVVIATNNDAAYALAEELTAAGIPVSAVADSRFHIPDPIRSAMRACSVEVLPGTLPVDTAGFSALRSVTLGRLSPNGARIESTRTFPCDALAVSGGFNPTLHLFTHAGGKLAYDDATHALLPVGGHPDMQIVGNAAVRTPVGPRIAPGGNSHRRWVDLLHDVTVSDLELALRENYTSVEHVKRFTTLGMAADQGKTSTPASLEVLGQLRDLPPRDLGHTTLRPPFVPVTLGAIAGRNIAERFAPSRRLPMHDWHVAHGALLQDFGEWQRPVVYSRGGESREDAVRREALAVRTSAGLFDGSSLGKIEIHGPDALEFLDRFYINDLTTLKPYRARYGLMLRESGIIFDDGTVVRLAPDRFLITTTSGNAARVAQWLEEWHQCEWPYLRVAVVPVTDQWATVSLAGPQSRAILSKLRSDIDLSATAFPHLSMREGTLLSSAVRIYRVSFTGELTYEINVPAGKGQALWDTLLTEGAAHHLQPFGMDALMLMRLEKGFLHIGADTDGTSIPDDVGWGKVAATKKADYIGKRSLALPEHRRPDRLQLIGVLGQNPSPRSDSPGIPTLFASSHAIPAHRPTDHVRSFIIGSHLRLDGSDEPTDGWITSAGIGVLTNEPIALAVLRGGRARIGAQVEVYDQGRLQGRARVLNPPFYNPAGDRMNA